SDAIAVVVSEQSGSISIAHAGRMIRRIDPERLSFFFGLLTASLAMVVMSRNGVLFLFWWEVMSFAAYFCLITEDTKPEVREAGSLYLIVSHVSALALFALFSLTKEMTGTFAFPAAGTLSPHSGIAVAVFLTALFGFGLKAGMMPLHVWLPSAHANAPSHISAILSGVVLKLGIYSLVRTLSFFAEIPLWWGALILTLGAVSGVVGVAFAIGQHDVKRLLAYHSIENIGIILMGVGVALIGQSAGNSSMMLLGMAGALLHVVNHATFKALLFLAAGSIIHAAGSREIDVMGGLLRRLPWTSGFFLVGAVAICGLPPLNGFVSEFLIYLGLLHGVTAQNGIAAGMPALGAPALALIGGLAVACFVKVFGIVFLGAPRSESAARGHEAPRTMLGGMAILAVICFVIGLMPWLAAPLLQRAAGGWRPVLAALPEPLATTAHLWWISGAAVFLVLVIAAGAFMLRGFLARLPAGTAETWGCGYTAPTTRMQYTASSFAEMLVYFFRGVLRPHTHLPTVRGPFPEATRFASHVPETTLDLVYIPLLQRLYDKTAPIRRMQNGRLQLYILYTFIILILLLAGTQA
ncbi:MAG TPA: proton-conducting transporter membrane subunit, partial [Geobacteraceae bacterium]|nr:proton-conducting transporter membrane subunit [Geobacteraceae bacterium]